LRVRAFIGIKEAPIDMETLLFELLISGFFAVACIRACVPTAPDGKLTFNDLFRFPGRLERLQRTRWQWFSMVALLLVLRLQAGLPLVLEVIVAAEFVIFMALPVKVAKTEAQRRRDAAIMGNR
jgi:hypothetical protein